MATVKKTTTKKTTKNVDEEVKVTPEVEVETEVVETTEPEAEVAEDNTEIEVDTKIADVKNAPTEKNVRVKLKKDFSFNFGSERYEFKEGQCYNVPVAVKLHLNKFDALSPL